MKANPSRRYRPYLELARQSGAEDARIIPARRVVTAEWVRLKCQYGCGGYGKRLCCPPYSPTPEQTRRVLAEYRHALIYRHPSTTHKRRTTKMTRLPAEIERALFLDGYYRAFGMSAGPCRLCATCDLTRRCKFPYLARPALEACGIDVFATCRNAGIPLEVVTRSDAPARYVNLILID